MTCILKVLYYLKSSCSEKYTFILIYYFLQMHSNYIKFLYRARAYVLSYIFHIKFSNTMKTHI